MEDGMSGFYIKAGGARGGANNGGGGGTKCGRWNPTAEQVKVLTDLFRAGLRTPSTDQIQKISTQLSFYGKIESKNVFYWFQNHKARERQKRRKVSVVVDDDQRKEVNIWRREDHHQKLPTKHFGEVINRGAEEEKRVIETLQLFPLNSYEEPEPEKLLRLHGNDQCRDVFSHAAFGTKMMDHHHPQLDLRLSFL